MDNRQFRNPQEFEAFKKRWDKIPDGKKKSWLRSKFFSSPDELKLSDWDGESVAHVAAKDNEFPEECMTEEFLTMPDLDGETPAHILAEHGSLPEDKMTDSLLMVSDRYGRRVVHMLAVSGTLPVSKMTPELMAEKGTVSLDSVTVAEALLQFLIKGAVKKTDSSANVPFLYDRLSGIPGVVLKMLLKTAEDIRVKKHKGFAVGVLLKVIETDIAGTIADVIRSILEQDTYAELDNTAGNFSGDTLPEDLYSCDLHRGK